MAAVLLVAASGALAATVWVSTFTVTNTSDSGAGSLRQAIRDANGHQGKDRITFGVFNVGGYAITPVTDLPEITDPVTIDGYSEPGAQRATAQAPAILKVAIDGANTSWGLSVRTDGAEIYGLVIYQASGPVADGEVCVNDGICVVGDNNVIAGNYIGVDHAGLFPIPNRGEGIELTGDGNIIGGASVGDRNLISANDNDGVDLAGVGNRVEGNWIGIDAIGGTLGNGQDGVSVSGGAKVADGNVIAGNVISGNLGDAVSVDGDDNTVLDNLIGTNAAGNAGIGNGGDGVALFGDRNQVDGNVIAGNDVGVSINELGSANTVRGNKIGTNAAGNAQLPNDTGVYIEGSENTIGGPGVGEGNLISGNNDDGIEIEDPNDGTATGNRLLGNLIGTRLNGAMALSNGDNGVQVNAEGENWVGGSQPGAGNVISANANDGISVWGGNTRIEGNRIGTNAAGTAALGNLDDGVHLRNTGWVGGSQPGAGNLISANTAAGIYLSGTTGVQVLGNKIGTNAAGVAGLGNGGAGILLGGADTSLVGGAEPGAGNVISANAGDGVAIDFGAAGNQILGNAIGTNANGTMNLANAGSGIRVYSGDGNRIGTDGASGRMNTIAHNGGDGVTIDAGTNNAVTGNSIFDNAGLGIDLIPVNVTANDGAPDSDAGPNDLQNHPVIFTAVTTPVATTITWSVDTMPLTQYRVEFFANGACDGSGHGEGRKFLGATLATTDANGKAAGITQTANTFAGASVVATATLVPGGTVLGSTSEFSACLLVQ
ncbi:hypothetical protein Prum_074810 [Phytohabitans rumicis]|uniref:Right handed beta helix domain-containing protein n=1 Tax=Phytohabitans rumicis TaxID=1076125 RepID=A0A6V8LGX7_9ACTN|nr:hypothetical protein Prum_074810 [Phytohabitans rumicis]